MGGAPQNLVIKEGRPLMKMADGRIIMGALEKKKFYSRTRHGAKNKKRSISGICEHFYFST